MPGRGLRREVGGVLGVAVLASIFAGHGGYTTAQAYVDGLRPAVFVGGLVLLVGAMLSMLMPPHLGVSRRSAPARDSGQQRDDEVVVRIRSEVAVW